eukprot:1280421-Pyramimonas_sp.AAC.1
MGELMAARTRQARECTSSLLALTLWQKPRAWRRASGGNEKRGERVSLWSACPAIFTNLGGPRACAAWLTTGSACMHAVILSGGPPPH